MIDDIQLQDYHETEEPDSPLIHVLNPTGSNDAYFAEFGWVGTGKDVVLPSSETRWSASGDTLTVDNPITLRWVTCRPTFNASADS